MLCMLRHLSHSDALGIVAYDTEVNVLCPLTFCDVKGRARLELALKRLRVGTQTNLSGGMLKGLELHCQEARGSGAPPTIQEQHDFLDAAKRDDVALVRQLVIANPSFVNCQPAGRWSALHHAAEAGDATAVRFLLEHGASPGAVNQEGQTPQDVANQRRSEANQEVVQLLKSPPDVKVPPVAAESAVPAASSSETSAAEPYTGLVRSTSLSTFGFGKDHSAELLQSLAHLAGGIYSFVENE